MTKSGITAAAAVVAGGGGTVISGDHPTRRNRDAISGRGLNARLMSAWAAARGVYGDEVHKLLCGGDANVKSVGVIFSGVIFSSLVLALCSLLNCRASKNQRGGVFQDNVMM